MNFQPKSTKSILGEWLDEAEKVRGLIADFIGASNNEIALTTCTGSGLNIVINGTQWKKGANVVFPENEHNPMDTSMLRRHGVESRTVKLTNGKIELSDLEKAVDDNTKILQISQVSYINGFRFDLREVSQIAHECGAKVLVDSTQAIGALETDVKKEKVDYVSAAPYKYLMGPAGLAFLYVSSKHLEDLEPDRVGWKNQLWEGDHAEKPLDSFNTAEKFEYGTIHFQGCYGLEKSLEYLNRIGIENIEERILDLTAYLWTSLAELGKEMYTPAENKAPIVSFYQKNAVAIASKLMHEKIKVTGRAAHGDHIRVSCHFYNTYEDIDYFIKNLTKIAN
jgi:selenocysteine lyase/cysteine desulfurase